MCYKAHCACAGLLGAAHASEVGLLFGTHKIAAPMKYLTGFQQNPKGAQKVSQELMLSFGNFVKTGNPCSIQQGDVAMPDWRPFSHAEPQTMVFDHVSYVQAN